MLLHVPQLEAHRQGRDILLTFRDDVGSILTEVVKCGDAVHLATAASILHREMLGHKLKSDVTFHTGCSEEVIPPSPREFVCIIEHGADIKHVVYKLLRQVQGRSKGTQTFERPRDVVCCIRWPDSVCEN